MSFSINEELVTKRRNVLLSDGYKCQLVADYLQDNLKRIQPLYELLSFLCSVDIYDTMSQDIINLVNRGSFAVTIPGGDCIIGSVVMQGNIGQLRLTVDDVSLGTILSWDTNDYSVGSVPSDEEMIVLMRLIQAVADMEAVTEALTNIMVTAASKSSQTRSDVFQCLNAYISSSNSAVKGVASQLLTALAASDASPASIILPTFQAITSVSAAEDGKWTWEAGGYVVEECVATVIWQAVSATASAIGAILLMVGGPVTKIIGAIIGIAGAIGSIVLNVMANMTHTVAQCNTNAIDYVYPEPVSNDVSTLLHLVPTGDATIYKWSNSMYTVFFYNIKRNESGVATSSDGYVFLNLWFHYNDVRDQAGDHNADYLSIGTQLTGSMSTFRPVFVGQLGTGVTTPYFVAGCTPSQWNNILQNSSTAIQPSDLNIKGNYRIFDNEGLVDSINSSVSWDLDSENSFSCLTPVDIDVYDRTPAGGVTREVGYISWMTSPLFSDLAIPMASYNDYLSTEEESEQLAYIACKSILRAMVYNEIFLAPASRSARDDLFIIRADYSASNDSINYSYRNGFEGSWLQRGLRLLSSSASDTIWASSDWAFVQNTMIHALKNQFMALTLEPSNENTVQNVFMDYDPPSDYALPYEVFTVNTAYWTPDPENFVTPPAYSKAAVMWSAAIGIVTTLAIMITTYVAYRAISGRLKQRWISKQEANTHAMISARNTGNFAEAARLSRKIERYNWIGQFAGWGSYNSNMMLYPAGLNTADSTEEITNQVDESFDSLSSQFKNTSDDIKKLISGQ